MEPVFLARSLETDMNDEHTSASLDTPLRADAFALNDQEKIKIIAGHFHSIMHTLGLDLQDDSLKDTPQRVAKMYVQEIFSGLNPQHAPEVTLFENKFRYNEMLIEKDITLFSYCEHHFVPIYGKVHVAYISSGKVIGLSKINRIVQYYARRPQVQERLVNQVADGLKKALDTPHVAVVINAVHLCVRSRGVKDTESSTITTHFSGKFAEEKTKMEFLSLIKG